ncbi:hypothetical protein E2C01_066902 [Portunus trituberculatus]|uniref:Uncharacterized protein n=1 Tax=Portunus trituberculatus TaxID=210409 RepID=A0A5B7HJG1_PORTR|nr:hypothetical protein [Portunus trituberculatus]
MFFLPYDVPGYLRPDPEVKGYTCSAHSWIVQKHNEGKTDCRLVLQYNTEFGGHDMSGFANNQMDYKAAMAQCPDFNCIGMICSGPTDSHYLPTNCWMKYNTHLTITGQSPVSVQNLHYCLRYTNLSACAGLFPSLPPTISPPRSVPPPHDWCCELNASRDPRH